MVAFNLLRYIVFGTTLVFSLIVLGISANFLAQTQGTGFGFFTIASVPGFGVATAVLTFAILIPPLVIDMLRKGAVTSLTATELGYIGFLWVLWLACGANSTAALFGFSFGDCSLYGATTASFCSQYQAFQAFSWLNWLILFFYWLALLIMALVAQSRGNNRAFMVPTTELTIPEAKNAPPQNYPPGGNITPGTYPPQGQYPQQSYTPSQYPQQGYTPGPAPAPMPPQGQMYQAPYGSSPAPHPPTNTIQV